MVNDDVPNQQQPRLEVLFDITELLEVDVKELIKNREA